VVTAGKKMPNSTQVTLKQLRYFTRIVECASISSASHYLNIAQTAIGLQVRALEASLGVTLLVRHPKGVFPTPEGKLIYDAALEILGSVNDMVMTVSEKSNSQPRNLWIGVSPNIVTAIGASAVVLQDDYIPGARLHIMEGFRSTLMQDIVRAELDWAIIPDASEVEGCRSIPIFNQSIMLICKPGTGLPPGPVTLKKLLTGDLVLGSQGQVIPNLLEKAAHSLGKKINVKFEVESVNTQRQLLLNENVWGLLPLASVEEEVNQGTLEAHIIIDPPLYVTGYFVTRLQDPVGTKDLPILEFIDMLIDKHMAKNPDSGWTLLNKMASLLHQ
jgi:LysR family transcriptional regulator, nitrogen assimilation regulatory protein